MTFVGLFVVFQKLNNSMERSPSWKAYSSSASHSQSYQFALHVSWDTTSNSIVFKPIAPRLYNEVKGRFNINDP